MHINLNQFPIFISKHAYQQQAQPKEPILQSRTKKENNAGSKQKQEENLKRLLTQLTNEMKQKYSLGQIDGKEKDKKEDAIEKLGI